MTTARSLQRRGAFTAIAIAAWIIVALIMWLESALAEPLPQPKLGATCPPGYETSAFYGLGVPRNAPPEIVNRLNNEINAALIDPRMKRRLADLGGTPLPGSPADFGKIIVNEAEKWAKVVKFAGIKAN